MSVSTLCLAVALGSAMPTGDLPGPADEFGVINVVSYLSITLFVVGFGVGPLLFAPRMLLRYLQAAWLTDQCPSCSGVNPSTPSRCSFTSSSRSHLRSLRTLQPCSRVVW